MKNGFQRINKRVGMAIAFLLLLAVCLAPVAALGVQGAKYTGTIAPGGTAAHTMTVSIGAGEKATDLQVAVMGFGQAMDKSYSALDPANDKSPYTARPFITLSNTTLHLEPGTSQVVTATISLPQNVGPGGRYALISIRSIARQGESVTEAVNVPVFITVSGTAPVETGSIVKIEMGTLTIGQSIIIKTTFSNTGNYHYYNTVDLVSIVDSGGNSIANTTTAPSAFAIIPGNKVQFIAKPATGSLAEGTYTVSSVISLEDGRVLDRKSARFNVTKAYTPPANKSGVTVHPGGPATLASPDGRYSVTFPQGAVLDDVAVTLNPYSRDQLHPAPPGAGLGASCFEITGLSGLLSRDASLQVIYSGDDLAAAGGDASLLKLAYWDNGQGQWVILPTQVNTQQKMLTATTNHLSVWAVMVSSSASVGSPAVSPSNSSRSGGMLALPAELSIIALAVASILVGGAAKWRRK